MISNEITKAEEAEDSGDGGGDDTA